MITLESLKPTTSSEIVGNTKLIKEFKEWLSNYDYKNVKNRAALVSGPLGIGKSLTVELLTKELKIKRILIESSECKSKPPASGIEDLNFTYISKIKCDINNLFLKKNTLKYDRVIVFENADSLTGTLVKEIINLIEKTKVPIIIICNDAYPLKTLAQKCYEVKFNRPTKVQIRKYLQNINLIKQNANNERVETMISEQGNDIRHIILSIIVRVQANKDGDGKMDLFTATKNMFSKSLTFKQKMESYYEDYSMVPLMVHENYINGYSKLEDISKAADSFCDYDISSKETGPGSWELINLMGALTIRSAKLSNAKLGMIGFSKMLGKMSSTRSNKDNITRILSNNKSPTSFNGYRLDFIPFFCRIIDQKLLEAESKNDNKERDLEIIEIINNLFHPYGISRDDYFDYFKKVELIDSAKYSSKTKTAFTRIYKKLNL